MTRIVVCSAALIAFIIGMNKLLHAAFDRFGFSVGMEICGVGIVTCGIIAFSWDYFEGKRSQELLPPERRDLQQ